jgi:hypothetical protein
MRVAENLHRFNKPSVYLLSRDDTATWEETTGAVVRSQCIPRLKRLMDAGVLEIISNRTGRLLFKRKRSRR